MFASKQILPSVTFYRNIVGIHSRRNVNYSCKLLVVGGGSGGISMAAKFSKILKKDEIIIVEPSDVHYYQPMFTLIGGGIKELSHSRRNTKDLIPKNTRWLQDKAKEFDPENNKISTVKGDEIKYDFMLVAMGLQLNYSDIPGVVEALENSDSNVCSIYSPKYVQKTYHSLQKFKSGNAIFTFPLSPIKCPGAPQKIAYIAEHYFRNTNKRKDANVIYNTTLPVIFGVEKYAKSLWKVAKKRNIEVNTQRNLVEVRSKSNEAVFQDLKEGGKTSITKYSILHVTPPQGTPPALKNCKSLTDANGFLSVDKENLRHTKYPNIFGIGDCTNSPNSKTVAAVAAQCGIVYDHLKAAMQKTKKPDSEYDGYASCPLITGYGTCILAEFDYKLQPKETFPFDQSKERQTMYLMKKDIMPPLYWYLMLNGQWNGPGAYRQLMHLGFAK